MPTNTNTDMADSHNWTRSLIDRVRATRLRVATTFVICIVAIILVEMPLQKILALGWGGAAIAMQFCEWWYGVRLVSKRAQITNAQRQTYQSVMFSAVTVFTASVPLLWFCGGIEGMIWAGMLTIMSAYVAINTLHGNRDLFWAAVTPHIFIIVGLALADVVLAFGTDDLLPKLILLLGVASIVQHYIQGFLTLNKSSRIHQETRLRLIAERQNALAANEAKSRFLAVTSHELRTPMNAMTGTVELIRRTNLDADQRRLLDLMSDGTDVLLALLNDILDLSKIESGNLDIERIPVDLHKLLYGLTEMWAPRAEDKDVSLRLEIARDVPRGIETDPTRLRQVLFNLLSNAVKFTDTGEIRIIVTVVREAGDDERLSIQVVDSGCGMNSETLERIFSPFQQADASTARRFGGTGLGLSIGRKLTELMDGSLTAESTEGVGSTFRFEIALVERDLPVTETGNRPQDESSYGDHLQILIAEDHPANRRILGALLKPLGCEIIVAKNGKEAVELFDIDEFDVVLMDVQMPEMDGLEATRMIRQMGPLGASTPIIALTANASSEDRKKCTDAGMTDFVPKPIDPRSLHSTILRAIKKRDALSDAEDRLSDSVA